MFDAIRISSTWYNICTVAYFLALFSYIANIAWRRNGLHKTATIIAAIGFLCQTFGMVLRWIEAGQVEVAAAEKASGMTLQGWGYFVVFTQHPPWSNLYEIMVYMSWGIVLVYLFVEARWRLRLLGIVALLLALVALGVASLTDGLIQPLVPALKSWWIMVHVISASIAYAAGSMAAIVSLLYLIQASDKIALTKIAAGTLWISALLEILMGRGWALFSTLSYKVKLIKQMGGELIVAGQVNDGTFRPYYTPSPGVGVLLILVVVLTVASAIWMWRQRKEDEPSLLARGIFGVSIIMTLAVIGLMVFNNLTQLNVDVPADLAATLMPPGPWRLAMKSNPWDMALMGIALIAQLFVGLAVFFPKHFRSLLPEAQRLDRVAYTTIMVAFALMAVVLITGALWAHYAWGRYWAWDPKETGALIIWVTYALYLHTRMTHGWAGVRSAVVAILGFFVIMAGFLGVNLGWFAQGLHSYGSS